MRSEHCGVVGVVLFCIMAASLAGASPQAERISAAEAVCIAREWLLDPQAQVASLSLDTADGRATNGTSWFLTLRGADGATHLVSVDARAGVVLFWGKLSPEYGDSAHEPEPTVSLTESHAIAVEFAQERHPGFRSGRWVPEIGGPYHGQRRRIWAWYEVIDPVSGALGPWDLSVEVSEDRPEVVGFYRSSLAPILVGTRPSIGRRAIVSIARRYALLDPARYPINQIILRVAMDDHLSQRLVWECLQVLGVDPDGSVNMYGVVHDAHTGEPLYPIAPFGGGKHHVRQISFPRRCSVLLEPGDKAMTTPLVPPDLRPDGLWVRAEHLRAVDGVRVEVDRKHVSIRAGDRSFAGSDLGAEWSNDGWRVPLRGAAKALGWRVEWDNVKKVAIVHVK